MLRIARGLRVHLHLRLSRHAHEGPVRRVLLHHVSTHLWSGAVDKLTALGATECNVLHARAHAVLRNLHLLRVTGHWLGLCTVHVRRHLTRRRLDRRSRMRKLHVRCFEVGWALSRVRLHVRAAGRVLRIVCLHALRSLKVWRQLVLMGHRTIWHAVVRPQHLRRWGMLEQLLVALVFV